MTIPYSLVDDFQDATFSTSTQRRVRALTRITDLFLAGSTGYSKQQIELFDEVFKMLVAAIELKARARLAVYLAKDPAAPSALVRVFAFDEEISVAGPILSQSTAIAGSDLATVARSRGPDHLCAIARRRTI